MKPVVLPKEECRAIIRAAERLNAAMEMCESNDVLTDPILATDRVLLNRTANRLRRDLQ